MRQANAVHFDFMYNTLLYCFLKFLKLPYIDKNQTNNLYLF